MILLGNNIITDNDEGTINIWENDLLSILEGHTQFIYHMCLLSNGNLLSV